MSQRASRTIEFESTRRAARPPFKKARQPAETHEVITEASRTQACSNTRSGNRWEDWLAQVCDECGVTINGSAPADPQIHNRELARRAFTEGSMGLGEAYMEGWWDCEALDELATRAMRASIDQKIENKARLVFEIAKARVFNFQKKSRAFQVGEKHYDTGNDLFEIMLDPTMSYSCGYWKGASNLYEAQVNKLDLLCRKLQLEKGMKLLDIGSGWGGLAEHAARNYGVEVLGVTVSKEQAALATERCCGLPIEFRLQDYRDLTGQFDRIVSVGMFEHVGVKNYRTYMQKCHSLLRDNGLFALHTIGTNRTHDLVDPWIKKYIFPNGKLPSLHQISGAYESWFVLEDLHNFGPDYDRTLMEWHRNFKNGWSELSGSYSNEFYRMWEYYLKVCAASFRSRENQLWQLVLSKPDGSVRYDSPR